MEQKMYSKLLVQGEKFVEQEKYEEAIAALEEAFKLILEKRKTEELTEKQRDILSNREFSSTKWLLMSCMRTGNQEKIEKIIEPYLEQEDIHTDYFDYNLLKEYYINTKQFDKARKVVEKHRDIYNEMMFRYYMLQIDRAAASTEEEKQQLLEKAKTFYDEYEEIDFAMANKLYADVLTYDLGNEEEGYFYKFIDTEEMLKTEIVDIYFSREEMIKQIEFAYVTNDRDTLNRMGMRFWGAVRERFYENGDSEAEYLKKFTDSFPAVRLVNYCQLVIYLSCAGKLDMAKKYLDYVDPEKSMLPRCKHCEHCYCYEKTEAMGIYYYASGAKEKAMECFKECVKLGSRDSIANFMINRA